MKGAFVLYVKDGQVEKAARTMNAIEKTIADLPPQSVTNMIDLALLGLPSKKDVREQLCQKMQNPDGRVASMRQPSALAATSSTSPDQRAGGPQSSHKNRTTIQSIIDGMIKVPGKDYWLSSTEVTQGQWESVMGYNLSEHRGDEFPAEHVSRDDCDAFVEKNSIRRKKPRSHDLNFQFQLTRNGGMPEQLAVRAREDVKFPVVKPNGGNPLNLHTRGIPHLFVLKADGTLLEEGHPMKLFTDEKLRSLRSGKE